MYTSDQDQNETVNESQDGIVALGESGSYPSIDLQNLQSYDAESPGIRPPTKKGKSQRKESLSPLKEPFLNKAHQPE